MNNYVKTKNVKKASTFVLTTSILMSNVYPVFADTNTSKDEVVYVKLNNNGNVDNVYVVNSFDIKNGEKLVDYGIYSNVVNLSTSDKLNYSNNVINANISDTNKKFYYQGDMKDCEIPWNIDIRYTLDGKNISSEELAGKSGNLEISFDIKKNDTVDEVFFNNYALQISLTLDGDKCSNIIADGATIASVGNNKTITYIKLAGEEASYTINSNVENFEMDSISFNGLNMDINVDINVDDMTSSFDTLVDAIDELNGGASDLKNGVDTYKNGVSTLYTGSSKLLEGVSNYKSGVNTLYTGSSKLLTGVSSYKNGVNTLYKGSSQLQEGVSNYKSGVNSLDKGINSLQSGLNGYKNGVTSLYTNSQKLLEGAKSLNSGVEALESGVNLLNQGSSNLESGLNTLSQGSASYKQNVNNYAQSVNQVVSALKSNLTEEQIQALNLDALISGAQGLASGYESIDAGINQSKSGASSISDGAGSLASNIGILSQGSSNLYSGIEALSSGSNALVSGINEIEGGASSLKSGSNSLVSGINEIEGGASSLKNGSSTLVSGIDSIGEGVSALSKGTNELNSKTSNLPDEIDDKIDEMVSKYSNSDFNPVSFASEENINVESVQFAIRTDAIKVKEEEKVEKEKDEEKSMWKLFTDLFKKDK
ncbi:hypothetical protein [Romboutsia ilealis]|uniref:hypothetical protein n=1 Tax=Romboutsia ilealis TaxID=1115758 RepID=UPI00267744A6|nr:hypothetical protein [Romboutsia ilealis]